MDLTNSYITFYPIVAEYISHQDIEHALGYIICYETKQANIFIKSQNHTQTIFHNNEINLELIISGILETV